MWTDTTRAQYAPSERALPSDLTEAEWAGAGTVPAASLACGPPSQVAAAADNRGEPLAAARWSAMADAATVLPAGLDGAALALPVAGQRSVVLAQPCPAADKALGGLPRSIAQYRGD